MKMGAATCIRNARKLMEPTMKTIAQNITPVKVKLNKLRCPVCGVVDEYPPDTKPERVAGQCGICYTHDQHNLYDKNYVDPFCRVCIAEHWKALILALVMLVCHWGKVRP